MLNRCLEVSTNMEYGLLVGWFLQVDIEGSAYLGETHVSRGIDAI